MRKKILLIVVLAINSVVAFGQTNVYHPFPDSGAVWRMNLESYCNIPMPGSCHTDYQYVTGGDTIINGDKYVKVYYQAMNSSCYLIQGNPFYQCSTPVYISFYYCAYRNDTIAKKVFKYAGGGNLDILLYDFNLNIGDSINADRCAQVIVDVDSIMINNAYRKKYILNNGNWIIEGIGHAGNQFGNVFTGPFDGCGEPCVCNMIWSFSCYRELGITVYPDTSKCVIINGINQIKASAFISLYPNPTSSQINISSSFIIDKTAITDVMGRLVYEAMPKQKDFRVEMDHKEGIYFITLSTDKERVVRKVVVAH